MRIPTTQKLADALREAGAPEGMIQEALNGFYDDFKSELPFPISQLASDAKRYGLEVIEARALNGDFDGQAWESDEWAASEEGQAAFRELGIQP